MILDGDNTNPNLASGSVQARHKAELHSENNPVNKKAKSPVSRTTARKNITHALLVAKTPDQKSRIRPYPLVASKTQAMYKRSKGEDEHDLVRHNLSDYENIRKKRNTEIATKTEPGRVNAIITDVKTKEENTSTEG